MSKKPSLTRTQRRLLNELEEIADLFNLDYPNIYRYEPEDRTVILENMKRKMMRGQVIVWYTLVDEYLGSEICRYFFGRKRSFPELWKTKRFQRFNHHILEELYPLQKLRLVKDLRSVPKSVSQKIESLNALRNGLAHSFFPENLRKSKPSWKGKSIFSLEGAKLFRDDVEEITTFFSKP